MRRIVSSLAALAMSIFMISTSVSASACDLSCWLHRSHSDCHAARSVSKDDMAMSMPSDMDMRPDRSDGMTVSKANVTTLSHRMFIAEIQMVTDNAVNPQTGRTDMPDHSKTVSSCAHEPCSQVWASVSPRSGENPLLISLHLMPVSIFNPVSLGIDSHSIRVETHPPNLPAFDRLATTLRI